MSQNLNHELPQKLIELERALATLAPVPAQLDRDRLMFEAGVARSLTGTPNVSTSPSDVALQDSMNQEIRAEPRSAVSGAVAVLPRPRRGTRRWWSMERIRLWRLATAAATLVACVFASLFLAQRNRPPVVVREIVTVERPASLEGPQVASTYNPESRGANSAPEFSHSAPSTLLSGLRAPFWIIGHYHAPASSNPAHYLALRQIVLTRGVDALPRLESLGDLGPLTPPQTAAELLNKILPRFHNRKSNDAADRCLSKPANHGMGETI